MSCTACHGAVLTEASLWTGPEPNASLAVREFTLIESSERITAASWQQSKASIQIGHKNVFAPANLRAAADNPAYSKLVAEWLAQKYTLRYSGGMVLDVHHILAKVGLNLPLAGLNLQTEMK